MKTREEKALEIAKLDGWEQIGDKTHKTEDYYKDCYANSKSELALTEIDLVCLFSSFNGLMEIVERVNKQNCTEGITIRILDTTVEVSKDWVWEEWNYLTIDNTLIDALQDAVLFYLKQVKK